MAISKLSLENDGRRGKGLVAFQSLSTIKKGTRRCSFQSNEPLSMFLRQLFCMKRPGLKKNWGKGGSCPPIILILKKGIRNSDYQSYDPPPKIIRRPFL